MIFCEECKISVFSWHISAALIGGFLTFLIQSSSATTGIVIAMAGSGVIGYEAGVAMVVGEVLGTSLVAVTATINGSLAAKRTALLYFLINAVAVTVALLIFPVLLKAVDLFSPGQAEFAVTNLSTIVPGAPSAATRPFIARHLANAHTLFNFCTVLLSLPLVGFLARTAPVILPGKEGPTDTEPRPKFIDSRVINTPTIALLQAKNELRRMADITRMMYDEVVGQFYKYDAKKAAGIQQKKVVLDVLQHEISSFLILLSRQSMTAERSIGIPVMLHIISDLKHIGDQNYAIMELLRRKKEEKITFSGTAMVELKALAAKVGERVKISTDAVGEDAGIDLQLVETGSDQIGGMLEAMLNSHMIRLTAGKCTVAAGMSYSDIISAFGKIADYAASVIEMERNLINDTASRGSN